MKLDVYIDIQPFLRNKVIATSSGVSRPRLRLGCECARLGARARARRRVRELLGCGGNML